MLKIINIMAVVATCIFFGCTAKNIEKKVNINETIVAEIVAENTVIESEIITNTYNFNEHNFLLISEILEKNIYLYGIKDEKNYNKGCVLYVEGTGHFYDIVWATPRFVLPQMKVYDFDNDGVEELAIINNYGSGIACDVFGLQIIEINAEIKEGDVWPIHTYSSDKYLGEANEFLYIKQDNQLKSRHDIIVGEKMINFDFVCEGDDNVEDIICYGDIVYFEFSDTGIDIKIGLGTKHKDWVVPDIFGYIRANCIFIDNDFYLVNPIFEA